MKMKTNDYSLSKKSYKNVPVSSFVPTTYGESLCKEIATELQELYMNYLLSILKRYGHNLIERAWGLYQETQSMGQTIRNPPAYFNGIITNLINDNE